MIDGRKKASSKIMPYNIESDYGMQANRIAMASLSASLESVSKESAKLFSPDQQTRADNSVEFDNQMSDGNTTLRPGTIMSNRGL